MIGRKTAQNNTTTVGGTIFSALRLNCTLCYGYFLVVYGRDFFCGAMKKEEKEEKILKIISSAFL